MTAGRGEVEMREALRETIALLEGYWNGAIRHASYTDEPLRTWRADRLAEWRAALAPSPRPPGEATREALVAIMALIDEGLIVRNTTNDGHFPSYMAESARIVKVLADAQAALLTPARPHAEPGG